MLEPQHAIRLLMARPEPELHRVAELIATLMAALGQASLTAGPRVRDSYETIEKT